MRVLVYSTGGYERPYLLKTNNDVHELVFSTERLVLQTVHLARGFDAVSVFTGDEVNSEVLSQLAAMSVRYIAVRATGYDNVDLLAAAKFDIRVANVPAYSPESIAEHAVALMLALDRKLQLASHQVNQHDFTIDNLVGFTLHGKTAGIIGTGKIGMATAKILSGFGCRLLAYDTQPDTVNADAIGLEYTSLQRLYAESDIITIHAPLNPATKYMINAASLAQMRKGVMLINTSRGGIVNTADIIASLEKGHTGYYGMDVYEHEKGVFLHDLSKGRLEDASLNKLMLFPNVIITPHQAFATAEALKAIAAATIGSLTGWERTGKAVNEIKPGLK